MGSIIFEGEKPFDLVIQRLPTAVAQDGIVMLTLPVFLATAPQQTVEIQVALQLEHAEQLWAQLDPAIRLVKAYHRNKR
jgi:hypothetical protein